MSRDLPDTFPPLVTTRMRVANAVKALEQENDALVEARDKALLRLEDQRKRLAAEQALVARFRRLRATDRVKLDRAASRIAALKREVADLKRRGGA